MLDPIHELVLAERDAAEVVAEYVRAGVPRDLALALVEFPPWPEPS